MVDAPPRTTRSLSSHDRRAAKNNALVVPRRALDANCVATSLATTASALQQRHRRRRRRQAHERDQLFTATPGRGETQASPTRHSRTRRRPLLSPARCGPECRALRLRRQGRRLHRHSLVRQLRRQLWRRGVRLPRLARHLRGAVLQRRVRRDARRLQRCERVLRPARLRRRVRRDARRVQRRFAAKPFDCNGARFDYFSWSVTRVVRRFSASTSGGHTFPKGRGVDRRRAHG